MFKTGVVLANECFNQSAKSGGIIGIFISSFFNLKVCCVFSLELPQKETQPNLSQICSYGIFFQGTQEQV